MMSHKAEIIKVLNELFQDKGEFALLFGSWAKDESLVTAESDVDCGVFFRDNISADELYYDIPEQFRSRIGRTLDIINLNTADIIISMQVVATGTVVFAHSGARLNAYRAQVLSRYIDFKQSRKIIEDNILKRPNYA
jgi:predicted nucleotidyltransferase